MSEATRRVLAVHIKMMLLSRKRHRAKVYFLMILSRTFAARGSQLWNRTRPRGLVQIESTHKGANKRSKYVTQTQQLRRESPTVTLTWHACKYEAHKLHQRYILKKDTLPPPAQLPGAYIIPYISGTLDDTGVHCRSFWWWQCSDRYILSLFPHLHTPFPHSPRP